MSEETYSYFTEQGYDKNALPNTKNIRVWTIKGLREYFQFQNNQRRDYQITKGNENVGQFDLTLKTFSGFIKQRFLIFEGLYQKILKERGLSFEYSLISDIPTNSDSFNIIIGHVVKIQKEVINSVDGQITYIMLDLEDSSGMFKAFILESLYVKTAPFILNEFVCLRGKKYLNKNKQASFDVQEIIDFGSLKKQKIRSTGNSRFLAISDLHFGSKKFNKHLWKLFIKWLLENYKEERINYIFFPGDLVDGLYTYPNQIMNLTHYEFSTQYQQLVEGLKMIPEEITVFIIPGNHDLVRLAEPQPKIYLDNLPSNIVSLNNPGEVIIEGVRILMYHGTNFFSCWDQTSLQANIKTDLLKIKRLMLQKRHLGPSFCGANLMPTQEDTLYIEHLPDIFLTGHIHSHAVEVSEELILINCSTFQNRTDYQEKMAFFPDVGVLSLICPSTNTVTAIDLKTFL